MALTLQDIATLFSQRGAEQYTGEPVTQLEHALQSAWLAEQAGADDELVTAALLHDLGHLLADHGATPTLRGIDDLHQFIALPFLRPLFGPRVLDAIRLHVDAKRYLCTMEPGYWETLSPASQHSLVLQGGAFTPKEAMQFAAQPFAQEAIRLRRYDDHAKVPGLVTPPLGYYMALVQRLAPVPAAVAAAAELTPVAA